MRSGIGRRSEQSRRAAATRSLKVSGADQYTVWNTDSQGNYLANVTGAGGLLPERRRPARSAAGAQAVMKPLNGKGRDEHEAR